MIKYLRIGSLITVSLGNGTNLTLTVITIGQDLIQGITTNGKFIFINIKKIQAICIPSNPQPIPTYTEMAIPVPQPQGITGLPKNIYFQVHKNFTAAQKQKIRDIINGVLFHWFTHQNEKWNGGANNGVSQLATCSNVYATKNLKPLWYRGVPITNGRTAANIAMDQFTQLIKDNGFKRSSPAMIDPRTSTTIYAATASNQFKVPISLQINPKQLDNPGLSILFLTGSMFHAWLHRAGFNDPKQTSYFIAEAPMCIMREFAPKNPSTPDSIYTQFFD